MGTKIEAVHFVKSRSGLFKKGSIKLAIKAALGCLKKHDAEPHEVDLLINTGIYRDDNIGEPAIAALIQQGIRANPGVRDDGGPGTFSFDLANGGCGFVTGAQLIDGFMTSESIDLGILVTSDVDPHSSSSEGYPFTPVGGAVMFEPSADDDGFRAFRTETFPKYSDMFESRIVFTTDHNGNHGRNRLHIRQKKNYLARCVDCAEGAVGRFIKEMELDLKQVDLIIPSQYPIDFPKMFRVRMGLRRSRVIDVSEEYGALHTAGPIVALGRAMDSGQFARAKNVLFVTVGAGITVAMALYTKEPEPVFDKDSLAVEEVEEAELQGMIEEDEGDTDESEG